LPVLQCSNGTVGNVNSSIAAAAAVLLSLLSLKLCLTLLKFGCKDVYVERSWRLQLLYLPPLDIPRDGKD